jgi:hypothetical protein
MEPPLGNSISTNVRNQNVQWVVWTFIILFFILIIWGSFRVYRYYSPFVTELNLTGSYTNTVITPNQYYYSGLVKFLGSASPLQVSLDTVANYFPAGTTQRNDSYSIVMQNASSNPVYVCYESATFRPSTTISVSALNGSISYFTLSPNTSMLISMAYVSSSEVIVF